MSGILLDHKAELLVETAYPRDPRGVIQGLNSIAVLKEKKNAILFVHGFLETPALFAELVNDIQKEVLSDLYVPLLPFHGRDLQSAAQFNNQIILQNLNQIINKLARQYDSVTVLGMSYGGALLTALAHQEKIPTNVHLILYAPAFFLKDNTPWGRFKVQSYDLWRKYCNYKMLGCSLPAYQSGDEAARVMLDKEKSLGYVVMPAVIQLFQFDLEHRKELGEIHRSYDLIIAMDDNRVSYSAQKAVCQSNSPYCHLHSFSSGKHLIHWGANKRKFKDLLVKLINANEKK